MLDFGWHAVLPVAVSSRCQRSLPLSASRQTTCSRSSRGPDAAVMKSFLPKTTGEATLRPGRSAFHFTFSVGPKVVGRPFSAETPAPPGPGNGGQWAAGTPGTRSAVGRESRMLRRGRVRSGFDGSGRCGRGLLLGGDPLDRRGPAGRVAHPGHEVPDLGV